MHRSIVAGLTIILAIGGPTLKAYAQDPSARCVSVANEQMTIASAQGRGLYIENFSMPETVAFLKAFDAMPPNSNFIATKMFAAVGSDRAYVFFESDKDLCTTPSPLSRESYDACREGAGEWRLTTAAAVREGIFQCSSSSIRLSGYDRRPGRVSSLAFLGSRRA